MSCSYNYVDGRENCPYGSNMCMDPISVAPMLICPAAIFNPSRPQSVYVIEIHHGNIFYLVTL